MYRTRFIPMAKHENKSTYICTDNTRISEKTFFVSLEFGGYLLTIVYAMLRDTEDLFLIVTWVFQGSKSEILIATKF